MANTTYPPGAPTQSGQLYTVDWALKSPTFFERAINFQIEQKFISDYIFRAGNAGAGAVVYERTLSQWEKYPVRGDAEIIEPGDLFPLVDLGETTRHTAMVDKFGAAALITDENIRRNQRDKVQEAIIKISNTIIRKTDARSMAVLDADPDKLVTTAAQSWGTAGCDPFSDLVDALGLGESQLLNYNFDTVIINPADAAKLLKNKDIRAALPRENVNVNPLLTGRLEGLAGLSYIQSPRKAAGSCYLLQKGITGVHAEEMPTYVNRIREEANERWRVQAGRVSVPIITDPKSLIEIRGI